MTGVPALAGVSSSHPRRARRWWNRSGACLCRCTWSATVAGVGPISLDECPNGAGVQAGNLGTL